MRYFSAILIFLSFLPGCQTKTSTKSSDNQDQGMHKVVISEVIQAEVYTFLRVKENDTIEWLAVPAMNVKVGDIYYYSEGFRMMDYDSKELNRKFNSIIFLEKLNSEPDTSLNVSPLISPGSSKAGLKKININIPPEAESISISELYSHKDLYSGKLVKVRGQVTKFSPQIMGKNWIHLQDGTEFNGSFDLTITSDKTVQVGDTLSLQGRITLNKDLGYGYFYDILMEDAVLK